MERVSLGRQELELLAADLVSFSGMDMSSFSTVFLAQTLQMHFGRTINVHRMMDEVRYLEGAKSHTNTKKASAFNRAPLKGLMKTHFTDARFIVKNIGVHFGLDNGGGKKLDKLIRDAVERNTSGWVDDEFASYIAHGMTISAYEERAAKKKITGEWIVFQEYGGKKYYLTLAAHSEGDEVIYGRVLDCYDMDFPFLRPSD